MPDGVDLLAAHDEALRNVWECIQAMTALEERRAGAERDYRLAKHDRTLYERDHNKTPVSIIADVVKGYRDIADLDFARNVAETECKANYEAILYWKKRADAIGRQIEREWVAPR